MRDQARCPYCCCEHTRPRAKFCHPDHARRFQNGSQRIRYRRRRDHAQVMARVIERGYRDSNWRRARCEPELEQLALAIFGTVPAPVVRHGDTLDAVA